MKLDLLQSEFESHCDYYLELCDGDVNEAIEMMRDHLYDNMNGSAIFLIEQILSELRTVSYKFSENIKYVQEYFGVKNG